MVDLLAYSAIDRDTEVSFVHRERDWLERADAEGRLIAPGRLLPVLPAGVVGNGHGNGHDNGHGEH
jgi:hypothetical protein